MVETEKVKEIKAKMAKVKTGTKAKTRAKRVKAKVANLKLLSTRDASMPRVETNFAGCSRPSTMATRDVTTKMSHGRIWTSEAKTT
jgi:hypothetical protein